MKLEELYADMSAKAGEACAAMNEGKPQKAIKNLQKIAKDAEKAYNAEVERLQYRAWNEEGNPVEIAIRERYVRNGKKVSYKATDTGRYYQEISDCTFLVDLLTMETVLGVEKFHAENWFTKVSKLAVLLANAKNKQLSNDPTFQYLVDEAVDEFNFAEDVDVTSNASAVKALQQTVDAILFLPIKNKKGVEVNRIKVDSRAWVYIQDCMTKQAKDPGDLGISDTGKMCELVTHAMYCIMIGKPFKVVKA